MNTQKLFVSLSSVAMISTTLFAVPKIYAQSPAAGIHMNFFQEFIQFISQKFGLDKTQVQSAVIDFKNQHKANITPRPTLSPQQITDREKSRLDLLVKDGKITPNQETAIMGELAALRTKYNLGSQKGLTPEERKTQMTAMRDEIVSWAKSQGIDSSYVMPGFGMGGRGMGGRGWSMEGRKNDWGRWQNGTVTPTPTP
jgi:hypothetical protein